MSLEADFTVHRGNFTLNFGAILEGGSVVAILGPNGAGKSTLVRVIAGLQPISSGFLRLGSEIVDDAAGHFVPPQKRAVGVVFQDYALFPHLSILENVAFGPRSRGSGRAEARVIALSMLDTLGVGDLRARRPKAISGGQAQRVALARALATRPEVLLLDEPMAALDIETRQTVRVELERQLAAFAGCTVMITHDPLDAMLLADRVIVVESGQIVQDGSPVDLAQRPTTAYVAALMGVTLLRGSVAGGKLTLDDGGMLRIADQTIAGRALAVLRPEAITIHRSEPEGSARNHWEAIVTSIQPSHDRVRVHLSGKPSVVAAVTPTAVSELGIGKGMRVWLSVKAVEIDTYLNPTR